MSSPPPHMILEIDREQTIQNPMPCVVCIVYDSINKQPNAICRADIGSIRCKTHRMRCATCRGSVSKDTHLCCHDCWAFDRVQTLVKRTTLESLLIEGRLCNYDHVDLTENEKKQCACLRCVETTVSYMKARALEEGEAHRIIPLLHSTPDHSTVNMDGK